MAEKIRAASYRVTPSQNHRTERTSAHAISTQVWAFLDTKGQPLRDSSGRQVGARVQLLRETFADGTSQLNRMGWGGWMYPAGTWEAYVPTALRNGKPYGPTQRPTLWSTPERRDHEARRYLIQAARRAFKAAQAKGGTQELGGIRLESEVRP